MCKTLKINVIIQDLITKLIMYDKNLPYKHCRKCIYYNKINNECKLYTKKLNSPTLAIDSRLNDTLCELNGKNYTNKYFLITDILKVVTAGSLVFITVELIKFNNLNNKYT
jgi:hypothetical protein